MLPKTQILSIVVVIDSRDNDGFMVLRKISDMAKELGLYYEIVVIVNRYYSAADLRDLKNLSNEVENLQIFFLKNVIDYKAAAMVGLENSIGDWVLTIDVYYDAIDAVKSMLEVAFKDNSEVVIALDPKISHGGIIISFLSFVFNLLFKILHKYKLSEESSSLKLFSRTITNYILQHNAPLVAIETIAAQSNIKKSIVTQTTKKNSQLSLRERIRNHWMILIGINHMPLRIANLISGFGASLALFYSVYVVIINLFRNNVVAGWTTVSLIMSMMFFTMSAVLWLISEYLVMLMDPYSRKSRYEIVERISSNIQARDHYTNIELEKN